MTHISSVFASALHDRLVPSAPSLSPSPFAATSATAPLVPLSPLGATVSLVPTSSGFNLLPSPFTPSGLSSLFAPSPASMAGAPGASPLTSAEMFSQQRQFPFTTATSFPQSTPTLSFAGGLPSQASLFEMATMPPITPTGMPSSSCFNLTSSSGTARGSWAPTEDELGPEFMLGDVPADFMRLGDIESIPMDDNSIDQLAQAVRLEQMKSGGWAAGMEKLSEAAVLGAAAPALSGARLPLKTIPATVFTPTATTATTISTSSASDFSVPSGEAAADAFPVQDALMSLLSDVGADGDGDEAASDDWAAVKDAGAAPTATSLEVPSEAAAGLSEEQQRILRLHRRQQQQQQQQQQQEEFQQEQLRQQQLRQESEQVEKEYEQFLHELVDPSTPLGRKQYLQRSKSTTNKTSRAGGGKVLQQEAKLLAASALGLHSYSEIENASPWPASPANTMSDAASTASPSTPTLSGGVMKTKKMSLKGKGAKGDSKLKKKSLKGKGVKGDSKLKRKSGLSSQILGTTASSSSLGKKSSSSRNLLLSSAASRRPVTVDDDLLDPDTLVTRKRNRIAARRNRALRKARFEKMLEHSENLAVENDKLREAAAECRGQIAELLQAVRDRVSKSVTLRALLQVPAAAPSSARSLASVKAAPMSRAALREAVGV